MTRARPNGWSFPAATPQGRHTTRHADHLELPSIRTIFCTLPTIAVKNPSQCLGKLRQWLQARGMDARPVRSSSNHMRQDRAAIWRVSKDMIDPVFPAIT
jgi:hypothetical protein